MKRRREASPETNYTGPDLKLPDSKESYERERIVELGHEKQVDFRHGRNREI